MSFIEFVRAVVAGATTRVVIASEILCRVVVSRNLLVRSGKRTSNRSTAIESGCFDPINDAGDIIYVYDLQGIILHCNDVVTDLLGYSIEEVIGKSILHFLYYDARRKTQAYLRKIVESEAVSGIVSLRSSSGARRIFEYRNVLLSDNRKTTSIRGRAREITTRVQMKNELRKSRHRCKQLLAEVTALRSTVEANSHAVLRIQEEDRKQISRDLHDDLGQFLTAMNVGLGMIRTNILREEVVSLRKVNDLQNLVEEAFESVHRITREIRHLLADDRGFISAMRAHAAYFSGWAGIPVLFNADPHVEHVSRDQKAVLYRIMQESLTNVAKHANALRVEIDIAKEAGAVHMRIRDDGRALALDPSDSEGMGLGMLGMKERAVTVKGDLAVSSEAGVGTTICVTIPIHEPLGE